MNRELLYQAYQEWQKFLNSFTEEEKKTIKFSPEQLEVNNIPYFIAADDSMKFDQTINRLSNNHKFTEEFIPIIYEYYQKRDLYELAHDYILNAKKYLDEISSVISPNIQYLIANSENSKLLLRYKISLERIRNLSAINIPQITPDIINDKRQLNLFILHEIIQAIKILKDKREAIREITRENRYNDYIEAILKLRLTFWGWLITNQPRSGTSVAGADAGIADFKIYAGDKNIAVIEAFILGNKQYTQDHLMKIVNYDESLERFYIIVYCLGNLADFENKWVEYQSHVKSTNFDSRFLFDVQKGFLDISEDFEDVNNIKIGKTCHGTNIDLYHIMINLALS